MADSISKYFTSEIREFKRSEIHPAPYNPRTISAEGKKNLKRSLKKFGVLGGIVVNARTGYTIVGGHQKVLVLDEENKYPENDYVIRAEVIDVDEKTEKTINITLNNPQVGGDWDYDKMRELVPDIDYKAAGLTDADLSFIGLDYLLQTEQQIGMAASLNDLMSEANEQHAQEVAARKAARQQAIENGSAGLMEDEDDDRDEESEYVFEEDSEADRQHRIQQMKDLKARVKEQAAEKAQNMDAYVTLSFTTWEAKAEFMEKFGFSPYDKFIKGEMFDEVCERVID